MSSLSTPSRPAEVHHRTDDEAQQYHEHSEHVAPFVAAIVLLQGIVVLWLVLVLWPVAGGTEQATIAILWGIHWTVTTEVALLALVLAVGALGSVVHEVQSLTYHRGNDDFLADWTIWYFLRPLLGAGLAGLLFFVVRGGLLQVDAPSESINVFGMAAFAGLAGLFATPAMTKLSNIFDTLLGPAKVTSDDEPTKWDVRTADGGLFDSLSSLRARHPDWTDDQLRELMSPSGNPPADSE